MKLARSQTGNSFSTITFKDVIDASVGITSVVAVRSGSTGTEILVRVSTIAERAALCGTTNTDKEKSNVKLM